VYEIHTLGKVCHIQQEYKMTAKISRIIVLISLTITLILGNTACSKVEVKIGNNGCNVAACTNQPNKTGIFIK
jgi:hypothetical protein